MDDAFDMQAAIGFQLRKEQRLRDRRTELYERARSEAGAIVDALVAEFRPLRVYPWGSLLDPDRFDDART
jgi:hypothetical protein